MSIRQYVQVKALALPDPAVYCPANGYDYNPIIYTPPIPMMTPPAESIVLLCSNLSSNSIYISGSALLTYTVYNSVGTFVYTENKAANYPFQYSYPTGASVPYYTIIVTPQVGSHILTFGIGSHPSFGKNQPIYKAIYNTPYLTSMQGAFSTCPYFKACDIISTLDNVTDMSSCFNGTPITYFKFPSHMNALTTMQYLFQSSNIISIDFNNCSFPLLTIMSYMFNLASYVKSLMITISAPKVYGFVSFATSCIALTYCNMDFAPAPTTGTVAFDNAFNGDKKLETLILPNFTASAIPFVFSYIVNGCTALKTINYRGNINCTGTSYMPIYLCPNLETITVEGDAVVTGAAAILDSGQYSTTPYIVIKKGFTGTINNSGLGIKTITFLQTFTTLVQVVCTSKAILEFNYPWLRVTKLWLGQAGAPIHVLAIDWVNSVFVTGTSSSPAIYVGGAYSAAELNAIYTALPIASSPTYITFSPCVGYAASTKTIATAKNYLFI